jgi:hypothetical protein
MAPFGLDLGSLEIFRSTTARVNSIALFSAKRRAAYEESLPGRRKVAVEDLKRNLRGQFDALNKALERAESLLQ